MAFSAGVSRRQSGHHDAQKCISTYLPRSALSLTGCPSVPVPTTMSGASVPAVSKRVAYLASRSWADAVVSMAIRASIVVNIRVLIPYIISIAVTKVANSACVSVIMMVKYTKNRHCASLFVGK